MKKNFPKTALIPALILALMLSACSGVIKVNPDNLGLNKSYVFKADISYGEFSAKAEFKRVNESHWEIALTEPYALNGLKYVYKSGKITATFGALGAEFSAGAQSEAIYKLIADMFENAFCGTGGVRVAQASKTDVNISGKAGDKTYELILDKKSKKPLSLKIPALNLTAEFSDAGISDIVVFFQDEEPSDNVPDGVRVIE